MTGFLEEEDSGAQMQLPAKCMDMLGTHPNANHIRKAASRTTQRRSHRDFRWGAGGHPSTYLGQVLVRLLLL
jgi:hypothetical protein